ncbi:PAS domain-containing protein, partial [Kitasatospora phosalacinea]|uniref:PAS domain-containing protein n=1 Tax=Kitasatospora phosalacinea TaxID=2065 RepID=UPI003661062D
MVDQPDSTPPSGVVALLRVAAVLVDPDGRIALWNRTAEELFGHRAEVALGRTAHGLLPAVEPRPDGSGPAQRHDALDTLDDLVLDGPWAGPMAVHDREERLRDVLWWAYPLVEPVGRSLLALAADARPLRTAGPRIALGERLVPYAAAPAAARPQQVTAVFAPPGPGAAEALAALLPPGSEERRRRLLDALAQAGPPALRVDGATRLPVVPYQSSPEGTGTARVAAGIGRRYPTPQQRAARRTDAPAPGTGAQGGSGVRIAPAGSAAAPQGAPQ